MRTLRSVCLDGFCGVDGTTPQMKVIRDLAFLFPRPDVSFVADISDDDDAIACTRVSVRETQTT